MAFSTLSANQLKNTLLEVTRRIVETAHPQRIVLFGSAVRGKMTTDSDLDMLVIMYGSVHRREMAQKIYRNLHGIDLPVDVVVVTEEDVLNAASGFSIIRPALEEGQVLYDAK